MKTLKQKIISVISYILFLILTIFMGSWAISYLIQVSNPKEISWFTSNTKEYICRIDTFRGIPVCYEVEGRNCNEEEGSYLVSIPYSYNYQLDKPEESRLCIYPEQMADLYQGWFKTKGIIKLEGLHWNNLYKEELNK